MKPNSQIYVEASDWLVEFRSCDVDATERKNFHLWLKASPEHMRAYLELAAIWNEGSALDSDRAFDDARLLRELREVRNVTELPLARGKGPGEPRLFKVELGPTRPSGRIFAVAASCLLAIFACFWYFEARNTYSTGIGEERTISLADGSIVELNSDSRVRLNFSPKVRGVELLRGQALFQVAKDHARPFIVRTSAIQVRAVGTKFDVYQNQAATTVTVVEGTVAVLPAWSRSSAASSQAEESPPRTSIYAPTIRTGPGEMLLAAGEQVTVASAAPPTTVKADVIAATSWTQHQLIFRGATLQTVAAEFNRYNQRHLVIQDREIADFRVTGIFSSTDPTSLIRFLKARLDIALVESADEIRVTHKP